MQGLFLNGKIVASDIKSGNRKDDGVPYARRISVISTGTGVVTYSESIDPVGKEEPLPLMKDISVTGITYANTNGGMVSVNGDHTIAK